MGKWNNGLTSGAQNHVVISLQLFCKNFPVDHCYHPPWQLITHPKKVADAHPKVPCRSPAGPSRPNARRPAIRRTGRSASPAETVPPFSKIFNGPCAAAAVFGTTLLLKICVGPHRSPPKNLAVPTGPHEKFWRSPPVPTKNFGGPHRSPRKK